MNTPLRHNDWQTTLPEEEGDWLWISQWSCGCCLIKYGIASVEGIDNPPVEKIEYGENSDHFFYTIADGRMMKIYWGHVTRPYYCIDSNIPQPCIHWWKKIEFPPYPEDLEREISHE